MSKQITAPELSDTVKYMLTNCPMSHGVRQKFMTDLAKAVCRWAGGEIAGHADYQGDELMIGIRRNEFLPEDGGVWKDYDEEGEL